VFFSLLSLLTLVKVRTFLCFNDTRANLIKLECLILACVQAGLIFVSKARSLPASWVPYGAPLGLGSYFNLKY
jgi:hypothetical protein